MSNEQKPLKWWQAVIFAVVFFVGTPLIWWFFS